MVCFFRMSCFFRVCSMFGFSGFRGFFNSVCFCGMLNCFGFLGCFCLDWCSGSWDCNNWSGNDWLSNYCWGMGNSFGRSLGSLLNSLGDGFFDSYFRLNGTIIPLATLATTGLVVFAYTFRAIFIIFYIFFNLLLSFKFGGLKTKFLKILNYKI